MYVLFHWATLLTSRITVTIRTRRVDQPKPNGLGALEVLPQVPVSRNRGDLLGSKPGRGETGESLGIEVLAFYVRSMICKTKTWKFVAGSPT